MILNSIDFFEATLSSKNIFFCPVKFIRKKSFVIKELYEYFIAINTELIDSSIELLSILRHEVGHIELDEFYGTKTEYEDRQKIEYKVKRKVSLETVPPNELKTLLGNDTPIWDIADLFNVTEKDVLNAIEIYKTREWAGI